LKLIIKNNIALFIAILFHVCGAAGILFSPYKQWFISNTTTNLIIMFVLLLVTQKVNLHFILFTIIAFVVGMVTETIGVKTGILFGSYHYGSVMGYQLNGVPLLIGINWAITVFCCCTMIYKVESFLMKRLSDAAKISTAISTLSFIIDVGLLATLFDYIIEPVAVKLGYWQWHSTHIPRLNYVCWFMISAALALVFRKLKFNKHNQFAIHLFIIQLLFFFALSIYL
jgi:bisanhydrobacterioruberin hydratase